MSNKHDEVAKRIATEGWETFVDEPDESRIAAILREFFPAPSESAKSCDGCFYYHGPGSALSCWYSFGHGETCARLCKDKIIDRHTGATK